MTHPIRVGDEVPRRPPERPVVEPQIEEQLAPAFVRKLAGRPPIEMEQIEG